MLTAEQLAFAEEQAKTGWFIDEYNWDSYYQAGMIPWDLGYSSNQYPGLPGLKIGEEATLVKWETIVGGVHYYEYARPGEEPTWDETRKYVPTFQPADVNPVTVAPINIDPSDTVIIPSKIKRPLEGGAISQGDWLAPFAIFLGIGMLLTKHHSKRRKKK